MRRKKARSIPSWDNVGPRPGGCRTSVQVLSAYPISLVLLVWHGIDTLEMAYELIDLIRHGREERNLEYVGPSSWSEIRAKVIKTILAMSNIQDGGAIVIGVEDSTFVPKGLSSSQSASFDQDDISVYLNNYADPYAEITVSHEEWEGQQFVVVQVNEFSEIPVICKRDGDRGLRTGAMFTRPRRKIETAEVPSQAEMREIIELATEKGIRKMYGRIDRAGIEVTSQGERDREEFNSQLDAL